MPWVRGGGEAAVSEMLACLEALIVHMAVLTLKQAWRQKSACLPRSRPPEAWTEERKESFGTPEQSGIPSGHCHTHRQPAPLSLNPGPRSCPASSPWYREHSSNLTWNLAGILSNFVVALLYT
jgi:hypothetical protein